MKNEDLTSVREKLENLKRNPRKVPNPLDIIPEKDKKPLGGGMFTFERVFQQRIEKSMKKISAIKERMKTSEMFMNYFYDLKRAEQEFLDLVAESEEKYVEFPSNFLKKIGDVKVKIRSKIR